MVPKDASSQNFTSAQLQQVCLPEGLIRGPFGGSLTKSEFVSSGYQVYEQRHAIYGTEVPARYFVSASKFHSMKRFSVQPGDFIVSCSGTIGKISRVSESSPPGIINQALLIIRLDKTVVVPEFFLQYFRWDYFQQSITESIQGGAMKNLVGMDKFKTAEVLLPNFNEQIKIAKLLSDADDLIHSVERLISKKHAIKQGVIQKIVSDLQGETRTLGNIGVTIRGVSYNPSTDLRSSPGIDSVDLFRANNIQGSRLDFSDMQYISARRPRMDQFLQEDDILICSANGSKRLVGKAALVGQLPRESTFGAFMMVYRPDPDLIDPIFAALQFQTRPFRDWIDVLLSGSSINNLRPRDVTSFEIVLPSSDEQREIAQIIRDIDAEIDALERRLESARNIKQGLMQELLTGRTRLPVEEVSS